MIGVMGFMGLPGGDVGSNEELQPLVGEPGSV